MGEKYGNGEKIPFFSPPLIFFASFSVTSRKKTGPGGKYYIVSPQALIQEAV
jgi:hypothetical protein